MIEDDEPTIDKRSQRSAIARRTSPRGVPIASVVESTMDTPGKIAAVGEAAEDAVNLAESVDQRLRPIESGITWLRRGLAAIGTAAVGAVFAVVAQLRSAARDDGAATERNRALQEEVRQLKTDVRELRDLVYRLAPLAWPTPRIAPPEPKGPLAP